MEKLAPLLNVEVIPELGRQLCEELGYKYIGEIPDQEGFKQRVLDAQIEAEKKLARRGFIADRSTVDCWVLWQRWNICKAMTYTTEEVACTSPLLYAHNSHTTDVRTNRRWVQMGGCRLPATNRQNYAYDSLRMESSGQKPFHQITRY